MGLAARAIVKKFYDAFTRSIVLSGDGDRGEARFAADGISSRGRGLQILRHLAGGNLGVWAVSIFPLCGGSHG